MISAAKRLAALVERCEADKAAIAAERKAGDALALEVGGELELRWRVAVLRSLMANPPDGDAVRELYGELVDRFRDDAARLKVVRGLGDEIKKLERAGTLPSTMVARTKLVRDPSRISRTRIKIAIGKLQRARLNDAPLSVSFSRYQR